MDNLFRWSPTNNHHLSVAAVILNNEGMILVHKLARIGGKYFLPKKTHSNNAALEQTLELVEKETGFKTHPFKFLGSRQSTFNTEENQEIKKTTLYFLCNIVEVTERDANDRDSDSELMWLKKDELIAIFKEQGRTENDLDESVILESL